MPDGSAPFSPGVSHETIGRLLSELEFCVIDTETTGGNPAYNRIIDVAVLRFKGGEIVETFQSLVNPGRPVPPWITQLTGIDDRMVADAPTFDQVADPLHAILSRGVFTAHNANFDFGFVREEFARLFIPFERPQVCTLKLARLLYADLPSRSLGTLCENLFIDIWDRHRAYGDAEATVYVLKEILRKAEREHGVSTWDDLEGLLFCGRMKLPEGVAYQTVARLPSAPGQFIMRDLDGRVVHRGRSKDVRRRVKTLFQETNQSPKADRLRETVRSIAYAPVEVEENRERNKRSAQEEWPAEEEKAHALPPTPLRLPRPA